MDFYLIHPREIARLVRERNAVVIDVRERDAYRSFHYQKAKNCPYEDILRYTGNLQRNRVYILYCDHGGTSLIAARLLGKEGYEVYSVVGGLDAIQNYQRMVFGGRDDSK